MLESLSFYARVSHIAAGDLDVDMQHLPSLQKVDACLWSEENCSPAVKKVADLLELASNAHPNRLTFRWGLLCKSFLLRSQTYVDFDIIIA